MSVIFLIRWNRSQICVTPGIILFIASVKRLVSVGPEVPEGFEDFHKGIEAAAPFVKQNPGEILPLNGIGEPHFMMAGENGACVFEFANYHDGNGLRFTNPKVQFTDVLSQK